MERTSPPRARFGRPEGKTPSAGSGCWSAGLSRRATNAPDGPTAADLNDGPPTCFVRRRNSVDDGSLCACPACAGRLCELLKRDGARPCAPTAGAADSFYSISERVKTRRSAGPLPLFGWTHTFLVCAIVYFLHSAQSVWLSFVRSTVIRRYGRVWSRRRCSGLFCTVHLLSLLVSTGFSSSLMVSSTSSTGARSDLDPGLLSPAPTNPLLRHQHGSKLGADQHSSMCHIWTRHTPRDLCERSLWSRLKLLREISLFSRDCDAEEDNVQLGQLFRLDWRLLKSAKDLVAHTEHLLDGVRGRSCVLGAVNSDECLRCFNVVDQGLQQVERAYLSFARILRRFDCELAVDSDTATRPFSPNGTCADCKRWYRKWSLVQLVQVWKDPPCINWCYYAQLACPHLATSRVVDFGGHPAFLCRDLDIPQSRSGAETVRNRDGVSSCSCVHPCDLGPSPAQTAVPVGHSDGTKSFDFFADPDHCHQRAERCAKEKRAFWEEEEAAPGQRRRKKRRRRHSEDGAEPALPTGAGAPPQTRLLPLLLTLACSLW